MRDLAFAMIWAVLFPVALWSAHIGVLLWIWVALLAPNQELYGFMAGVPFNKVAVVATIFATIFGQDKKKFYVDPTLVIVFLIFIVATISTFFGIISSDESWFYYDKIYKEDILVVCIMTLMWSRHRIHMTLLVFCISIGFTSVTEGLEVFMTGGGHKVLGSGGLGDNNGIALVTVMTIPILYYIAQYSVIKKVKIVIYAVIAASILCVIGTNSRGGFIGLLILGTFFLWNTKNKFAGFAVVAVFAVFVTLIAPESWLDRIGSIHSSVTDTDANGSFMGRVVAWKISTLIAFDHPFFGGGFAAVAHAPVWYHYLDYIYKLSFIPSPNIPGYPLVAHSIYFEVLGDMGFTGLILFLSIIGLALYNCRNIRRMSRGSPDLEWADDLARMLQISIVVYMVSGAALSYAYAESFWILVALISRLNRTVKDTLRESSASTVASGSL
jgi:probable O-glycosylation ligase (exosortase A-associated)